MKEKLNIVKNVVKEKTKELGSDMLGFYEKHPVVSGMFAGTAFIYLALVVPGYTTHRKDKLEWVPMNKED